MRFVIAGPYDPEGFLSTATVFTEAEYDNGHGNLPIGDDARWVQLPNKLEA